METVWSLLKARLGKSTARIPQEIKQAEYEAEVNRVCAEINAEYDMRRLFFASREDLLQALESRE